MIVKQLTKHHLEFLSLKGSCTGSPESTLAKMPNCWKSHVVYGPVHEILVLIAYVQKPPIKAYTDVLSGVCDLNFSLRLFHLHSCFMYASSECSSESAHLHRPS